MSGRFGLCTVGADGHAINSFNEGLYTSLEEAEEAAHDFVARNSVEPFLSHLDRRMGAVGVRAWDGGFVDAERGVESESEAVGEAALYPADPADPTAPALTDVFEHALAGVMAAWDEERERLRAGHTYLYEEDRTTFEAAARRRRKNTFTLVGCRFVAAEEQP